MEEIIKLIYPTTNNIVKKEAASERNVKGCV